MKTRRIIPRLDIKGERVVKGIHLEGLRVIGKPFDLAKRYYEQGADEIFYMDIVASLYERNSLLHVIEEATREGIFIPITVGGGIRKLDDIKQILRSGADKVAINTAGVKNPEFITTASRRFGCQCIVGSIEAKYRGDKWEVFVDNGREKTGYDAVEWAKRLVKLGVGELLITSIDKEGTERGYDIELIRKIEEVTTVPIVACGGAGSCQDILDCLQKSRCDAISCSSILHYEKTTIKEIKNFLIKANMEIRPNEND
jgi:imidazole glycerol-phosphate synthase subunit HisF